MTWWQRVVAAVKRYWWAAALAALAAGLALWRIFVPRERATPPPLPGGGVEVAQVTQQQVDETRAAVAARLEQIGRAEAQVAAQEQQTHETLDAGRGDATDELLYGRRLDGD